MAYDIVDFEAKENYGFKQLFNFEKVKNKINPVEKIADANKFKLKPSIAPAPAAPTMIGGIPLASKPLAVPAAPPALAVIIATFSREERGPAIGSWTAWTGIAAATSASAAPWAPSTRLCILDILIMEFFPND